jgi:CubicO group peptidase (beta-lactamase class C family)
VTWSPGVAASARTRSRSRPGSARPAGATHGLRPGGHGGQFIFVLPDYDLVIVMTSMPSTNDDYVGTRLPELTAIVEQIIAAVEE